jgi:hypothetical protein
LKGHRHADDVFGTGRNRAVCVLHAPDRPESDVRPPCQLSLRPPHEPARRPYVLAAQYDQKAR